MLLKVQNFNLELMQGQKQKNKRAAITFEVRIRAYYEVRDDDGGEF